MTWVAIGVGVVGGVAQYAIGRSEKKKQEAALKSQVANAPKYEGSSALSDYYQKSLQQANTAAQQSAMYKQNMNLIRRNLGQGLAAGAGSGQLGQGQVAKLVAGANDASSNALVNAEQQRERRFNALGSASQMKSGEDYKKFQINQQQPWEAQYNLTALQAAQAAKMQEAGISNVVGGITSAAQVGAAKKKSKWDAQNSALYGKNKLDPKTGIPV